MLQQNISHYLFLFYRVRWFRTSVVLGCSELEVEWTIPETVGSGIYRIRHFGDYKYIFGGIFPYSGTSQSFQAS